MSDLNLPDKCHTYDIEDRIKTYEHKLRQDFQDWRELESFSLLLKQKKMSLKADFFARQAESLFLIAYPQIDRDELLFENIDWADYIEFYVDLNRASYTKLKAIRHLYAHGLAEGRLGRYLIAKGKANAAVDFFTSKILKYPQKKVFYLGYQKLLNRLANLTEKVDQDTSLESAKLSNKLIKLQLQLIKDKLSLKDKLIEAENSLQQLHQAKSERTDSLTIKANSSNNQLLHQSLTNFHHSKLIESDSQKKPPHNQFLKSQLTEGNECSSVIQDNSTQSGFNLPIDTEQAKLFDAYISLGDNCEAGIQFLRIGYKESSFFRFTSSTFDTTFEILKNDFNDVFSRQYIFPRPGTKNMIINDKYKIAFHSQLNSKINQHGEQEFLSTYNFDEAFQNETNKINYLIDKWNQLMKSNKKILFFLKNDSDKKYINESTANKLCELMLNNYANHNFQILCIQLRKFKEPQWKNPYLINRYFPFFAPRTSARKACHAAWNKIFAEFPLKK